MDKLKMAACGIDCGACGMYNAGHDLQAAESVVEWFRQQGWIAPDGDAHAVQRAVQSGTPSCDGCWGESHFCGCGRVNFRECCVEKGIDHCGACGDFPCAPYREWMSWHENHQKAMERVKALGNTKPAV